MIIIQTKLNIAGADVEPYRIPEPSATRINNRWSNDELLLAVQGEINFVIIDLLSDWNNI